MFRRLARALVAVALFAAGLRWIYDSNPWSGPTILWLTRSHGVHVNDWITFVLWYGAILVARPRWARLVIPMPVSVRGSVVATTSTGNELRLIESVPVRPSTGDGDEGSATTVAA